MTTVPHTVDPNFFQTLGSMALMDISFLSHVLFSMHFIFSLCSLCHVSYTWGGTKGSEEVLQSPFLLLSLIFTLTLLPVLHMWCIWSAARLQDFLIYHLATRTQNFCMLWDQLQRRTTCHFSLIPFIHCSHLKCAGKREVGSLGAGCFHGQLACHRHFLDSRDSTTGKELLEHLLNYFVTQRH